MVQAATEGRVDSFGNEIDSSVGYARGEILGGIADEVRRMIRGRALVQSCARERGLAEIFNLTGVTRAFPLTDGDAEKIRTQIGFYANFSGTAESVGLEYSGGSVDRHSACFANQVTSAVLASLLALVPNEPNVLSIVPEGHSHPCIRSATRVVGGQFSEVVGLDAGLEALRQIKPDLAAITTLTPQKFVFDESSTRELIGLANELGSKVLIDDAHGALRMAYYDQAPVLQLGHVDVSVNSMDKHMDGPRAALVVGVTESLEPIRDVIYELGLGAQFPNYVASLRSLEGYDPERIKTAGAHAHELLLKLQDALGTDRLYAAGPGVAISELDLTSIVLDRAGKDRIPLVPLEVSVLVSMRGLELGGLMTILTIAMPGASPGLRLMMFPDGTRAGVDRIATTIDQAVTFAAERSSDLDFCRRYILGG